MIVPTWDSFLEACQIMKWVSYLSAVVDESCTSQKFVFILFDLEMAHKFSLLTLLHGVYPLFCAESVLPTSFLPEREQTLDVDKDSCI